MSTGTELMSASAEIIAQLGLEPLPLEGGFFRELYRSAQRHESRSLASSIYYLMRAGEISRWHQVASDEIWFYHAGSPARQLLLFPDGSWEERIIGADIASGQRPQSVIPAGVWQAAELVDVSPDAWGLFGATVFPGFDYADFREGDAVELMRRWPGAAERIEKYHI